MGFTEVLTIVFIVLKLTHVITWPWVLVVLPEIIAVAGYLVVLLGMLLTAVGVIRHEEKERAQHKALRSIHRR